jgi:paraquat-inducible protein B
MKKANPAIIGGFVIGAVALVVIGLLALSSTNWFAARNSYVAYFPGSVNGLRVGANVDFRGVTIGQVTQVKVQYDASDQSFSIPVVMEFDLSRIEYVGREARADSEVANLDDLINAGLRAQLQTQSLLTGLLFVNLDFKPDTPVNLTEGAEPYPEIPTIASGMEQIQQSAGDIAAELPNVLNNLNNVLTSIDNELKASGGNVQEIVADMADIANRIRQRGPAFDKIFDNVDSATGEIRQTAETLDQILQTNQDAIGSLIDEWTVTASSVRRMADQINATIAENREGLRDFTENGLYEYTGLAQDAQRMVDQFTRVGEQIERDPAGFLFGDRVRQGVQPQ